MEYTPEIMEAIKAMAYGTSNEELVNNCGMDAAEATRIRKEYAEDIAQRHNVLKENGYYG